MSEEGECSLLGWQSCSLSRRFQSSRDQSNPAALAACGERDDSRWSHALLQQDFPPGEQALGTRSQDSWSHAREVGEQQPRQGPVTPQPLCHLLAALPAAQGLGAHVPIPGVPVLCDPRAWTGCTTWVPPCWGPASSLWAHPGGLKELVPKSTQFPNIPVV